MVRYMFSPKTLIALLWYCISYSQLNYHLARLGSCAYIFRHWQFFEHYLGIIALQWRHNGPDSVSNHQPRECLLSRLIKRRSKKTSKLRVTGNCAGSPVNSPHKGPVTRTMFPFHDVIMEYVLLYITTVLAIPRKEISYSHLLVFPKEYICGFICFVVFILRIHVALM